MSGDEDSSDDEVYTDSFTSHTTSNGSITTDSLTSNASALEDNSSVQRLNVSPTESQFTPEMPYLESTQSDQTTDGVFIQQPSSLDSDNSQNSTTTSPMPPAPRRSARSTKGAPLCNLVKFIPTAPLLLKWINQPCINRLSMFPAIKQID